MNTPREKPSSTLVEQEWHCLNCPKKGKRGGMYPALSHRRATGHRVFVKQTNEYVYG